MEFTENCLQAGVWALHLPLSADRREVFFRVNECFAKYLSQNYWLDKAFDLHA